MGDDVVVPASTTSTTSAAARIASSCSSPRISLLKADALRAAIDGGAALLAVCGGYQLLGRGYRGFHGEDMPGIGLLPLETVAGEKRMIGDVLLECELEPGERRTLAGFENHAGRTRLDPGARAAWACPLRLRERRRERLRGLPRRPRDRHISPRAAAAAQPVARRLAPLAGARAPHGGRGRAARAAARPARAAGRTRYLPGEPAPAAGSF